MLFSDYPNEPPPEPPTPDDPRRPDFIDYLAYGAAGMGALLVLMALASLVVAPDISVFMSLTAAAISLIPLAAFLRYRSFVATAWREQARLRELLGVRDRELAEAVSKWRGFKQNFDSVVSDARAKDAQETAALQEEARRRIAIASERDHTVDRLGKRLLTDSRKWIQAKLSPGNFATQRDRLAKVVDFCRKHEYEVPRDFEREMLAELKLEYEAVLRRDAAKQEQARIQAQIREEKRVEREQESERKRLEAEQRAIREALDAALKATTDIHSAEIDALRAKLAEAEARAERAKSQAQLTKAGHIYVISNIGSFGENVYKVGMTRRLEPLDRVIELGDASVPFPFDVHMMISCNDAPTLENQLHKALHNNRVNRVNLRKEFFRTDLETIHQIVVENHGEVDYIADPEALQYRETLEMSDDDFAYVTSHASEFGGGDDDEEEVE